MFFIGIKKRKKVVFRRVVIAKGKGGPLRQKKKGPLLHRRAKEGERKEGSFLKHEEVNF